MKQNKLLVSKETRLRAKRARLKPKQNEIHTQVTDLRGEIYTQITEIRNEMRDGFNALQQYILLGKVDKKFTVPPWKPTCPMYINFWVSYWEV